MSSSPIFPRTSYRAVLPATLAAVLSFVSLPLLAQSAPQSPPEPAGAASSPDTMPAQPGVNYGASVPNESDTEAAANATANFVPAQAILASTLDAKKLQPGANFEATLNGKVKLANGTELSSGTVLHGTVATDDMDVKGNAKLVLRFTSAQAKNGQSIPLHATIVGIQTPSEEETLSYTGHVEPKPNGWNASMRVVDQIGVASGVDLHSRLDSQNSGVFVTTSKDNVTLKKGSAIDLAIAPADSTQASVAQ